MLRPIDDHVVIRPIIEDSKTTSGIILPDTVDKEKPEKGEVVAVGNGRLLDSGQRAPLSVKVGDTVIFTKYSPNEVTFNNEDYFILLTILFSVSISFNLIAHFWLFKNSVEKKVTTRKVENYKKYSKDMSWINVIGTIEAQIDRVLVGVLFGFTSLAIYHVAKVIQDQLKNIWVVFVNMIMPRTYKKSKIKSIHFLLKIITPVFVVFFVIVLMVIFILPTIFTFVFDEKYFDAMNYLNVMLFGVLIGIPNAVLIIYFNTYSKLKDLLIIKITTSVVYFLSLILFDQRLLDYYPNPNI